MKSTRYENSIVVQTALSSNEWSVVSQHVSTREMWSLCGVCKESFKGVVALAQSRGFNEEQAIAFVRAVYLRQNVFVTGGAGVGKSHVLRAVSDALYDEFKVNAVKIAAPTGAAARVCSTGSIAGSTLHVLFNIRTRIRDPESSKFSISTGFSSTGEHGKAIDTRLAIDLIGDDGGEVGIEEDDDDEDDCYDKSQLQWKRRPTCVMDHYTRQRLAATRVLILDEVSMMGSEYVELVDESLRCTHCEPDKPFGGVQIVACGDFLQLKPVVTDSTPSGCVPSRFVLKPWAFQAPVWTSLRPIQLVRVVRQSDAKFANILNRMRVGKLSSTDLSWLKSSCRNYAVAPRLTIFHSNAKCNATNTKALQFLSGQSKVFLPRMYVVKVTSQDPFRVSVVENEYLIQNRLRPRFVFQQNLTLKMNARVRCTRNVYAGTYPNRVLKVANGQRGTIVGFKSWRSDYEDSDLEDQDEIDEDKIDRIEVLWDPVTSSDEPQQIAVSTVRVARKQKFTVSGNNVYAVTRQFPLQLAYAITIHTSQGTSIDAPVDVSAHACFPDKLGRFKVVEAAAYVALSRATSISNVRLIGRFDSKSVVADKTVLDYYQSIRTVQL